MLYKDSRGNLLKEGLIKKCPLDWKAINDYDFMRRKRHRFIYEPNIPCSKKEAEDAIRSAKDFVDTIRGLIKTKNPQQEFDF